MGATIMGAAAMGATAMGATMGAHCTESKAFFTFLKLTHRVTWMTSKKWIA